MSWLAAVVGWGLALALLVCLRSRMALIADAEHELRGAATAIALAAERMRRHGSSFAFASLVALQVERMNAGLADLGRARRSPVSGAPPGTDADRLAQVLGNLIANAAEHGTGPVEVNWRASPAGPRLEIRNRNRPRELEELSARRAAERGRGLRIAERAAEQLGASLQVEREGETTVARLELPDRPPGDDPLLDEHPHAA